MKMVEMKNTLKKAPARRSFMHVFLRIKDAE